MTTGFKFGTGKIIEYEVLSEAQTKRLIGIVMAAVTGTVQIDYQMRGEWVQLKPKTIIDRVKLKCYNDGWKSVGLRQVKGKTSGIAPPDAIVRYRRKAYRRVERALKELYAHDLINSYTIRPNGYLWVSWFDGYVQTERVSFKRWDINNIEWDMIPLDEHQIAMEYLRDIVFLSSNNFHRLIKE